MTGISTAPFATQCWIIDNGATNHMTCHKDWLTNIQSSSTNIRSVTLPNREFVVVSHIGIVFVRITFL